MRILSRNKVAGNRVNISNDELARHWRKYFGTSKEKIEAVGSFSAAAIAAGALGAKGINKKQLETLEKQLEQLKIIRELIRDQKMGLI